MQVMELYEEESLKLHQALLCKAGKRSRGRRKKGVSGGASQKVSGPDMQAAAPEGGETLSQRPLQKPGRGALQGTAEEGPSQGRGQVALEEAAREGCSRVRGQPEAAQN